MSTSSFWLGRQPILDLTGSTVAYELLFRSTATGEAVISSNSQATATVIAQAFSELGLAAVLGPCRGFINFDTELLLSDVVELLPPERTVLELLETVQFTPEVVARCAELRSRGFSFALDDVVEIGEGHAAILPLVEIVKIDVMAVRSSDLPALLARATAPGQRKMLAEKVDSHAQAQRCRQLGFDLFQGFFFARPALLEGRRTDTSRLVLVQLLQQSLGDTENVEIEQTFKQAPDLSYKLMRLVNSVALGLRSPIQSLSHALVILGRRQLQRWLQILLFAHHSTGDFPSPLLILAAARGRTMELLAERRSYDEGYRDRAFMAGILSLLDTLLEMPMQSLVGQLRLPDDVSSALLERTGPLGRLLALVEALEQTDTELVNTLLAQGDLCSPGELVTLQIAALAWANEIGEPMRWR